MTDSRPISRRFVHARHGDTIADHDGLAEIAVHVRHPNGAVRDICFPHDAIGPVLDAAHITSIDQLVRRSWTVLLGPEHLNPEHLSPAHLVNEPLGAHTWT